MKSSLAEIRENQRIAKFTATAVYEAVAAAQPGLLSEQQLKQLYPIILDAVYTANHAVLHVQQKSGRAFYDATREKVKRGRGARLLKSYAEKLKENGEFE